MASDAIFGLLFVCVILTQLRIFVDCSATLVIHLIKYENKNGRDWDDNACDPSGGTCDHMFQFCLDKRNGNDDISACSLKSFPVPNEALEENKNINELQAFSVVCGVSNPITRTVQDYKGFKFKVKVDDKGRAEWGSPDKVDFLSKSYKPEAKNIDTASFIRTNMHGTRTKAEATVLTFDMMVYCDENYYESDCSVYCVEYNNFECNSDTGTLQCKKGWYGISCDQSVDDCASVPCMYNGTCTDAHLSYTCHCGPYYTGNNCETIFDYCGHLNIVCQNGGTCMDGVCNCTKGYVGDRCEIDLCSYKTCLHGGSCKEGVCNCTKGYVGEHCQIDLCDNRTCYHGGSCVFGDCLCRHGYVGEDCSVDLCANVSCLHGGNCVVAQNASKGHCVCKKGYTGSQCDVDLCDLLECDHGKCAAGRCVCSPGFSGEFCETDIIDECKSGPCKNGGTCTSTGKSYKCSCVKSYSGQHCENAPNKVEHTGVRTKSSFNIAMVVGIAAGALLLLLIIIILAIVFSKKKRRRAARMRNFDNPTYENDAVVYDVPGPPVHMPTATSAEDVYDDTTVPNGIYDVPGPPDPVEKTGNYSRALPLVKKKSSSSV